MPAPPLLDMIRGLIAVPSVSSVSPSLDQSNRAVVERLAGWLEAEGFATEALPVPGRPGKLNLIASRGSGPGGLVLSGHTDTVPFDEGRWRHDPFAATIDGGRLYGLGAADMKSFLALAIEAARGFDATALRRPLLILATADEESSMHGARALAALGRPLGRYAVIGEPTGLRPVRMHKGILMEANRLEGRSGHSSDPDLGRNALEGMYRVMGAILEWRRELQAQHRHPAFKVPVPTLNLGHIHGGDNPNRICAECELHIDLRPLPGMSLDGLRQALRARLEGAVEGSGLQLSTHALFDGIEAMETAPDSVLVRTAETLTGHAAEAVAFGTEAPYLQELGMETLVLGPGHIDQAHQPDEYLALDTLEPTVEILRGLIRHFCVEPAGERA